MATATRIRILAAIVSVLGSSTRLQVATQPVSREQAAIERLHQLDVEATLSDSADRLTALWDRDAVRLHAGGPPEIGKAAIYADDKRWEARPSRGRSLSYKPEVKDLQIVGEWAFEWGTFEASSTGSTPATRVTVHGKQLRILKRQPDGSWKFARVMSLLDSRQASEAK